MLLVHRLSLSLLLKDARNIFLVQLVFFLRQDADVFVREGTVRSIINLVDRIFVVVGLAL